MTYLIGVDVGTQSVRSCLFDLKGTVVASATRPLATTYPKPAWAEQDAEAWWRGAVETLQEIMQVSRVNPKDVAGLSYDCTACTVVACDLDGRPLRPALLWMDERADGRGGRGVGDRTRAPPVLRGQGLAAVDDPQGALAGATSRRCSPRPAGSWTRRTSSRCASRAG